MNGSPNLAASVSARLLNLAKKTGDDFQSVLAAYCFERFLYRLGASDCSDRFILKGAMLLKLWSDRPYRATLDLDLLRRGDGASEAIRDDLRIIAATLVPPDGVVFDGDAIRLETIRAEDEYAGTRAILPARLGNAILNLHIDIGLGDAVWPSPRACAYPVLLNLPAPELLAYPREAVIAEKLEAMVVLGDRNSRIKDFFDLHFLAGHFEFDRVTLLEAIRRTFDRRHTPIPGETPIALTREYWNNPSRPAQIRAFARRSRIEIPEKFEDECAAALDAFLTPLLEDLQAGRDSAGAWTPSGGWR